MTNDTNEPTVPTIDFIDRKQLSEASVSNSSVLLWPIRVPLTKRLTPTPAAHDPALSTGSDGDSLEKLINR
jgi:hypothetical protein